MGLSPIGVTLTLDIVSVLSKEFLDIQATIDYGFTLNWVCDMIQTYNQSDKSNLLFFDIPNNLKNKAEINISINGQEIKQKSHTKYAEVTLDSWLFWQQHIDNIRHKINIGIGLLKAVRNYVQKIS